MPPAARTVWASRRCRFPTTRTWLPASVAAIAARSPAAPVPMTSTLQTRLRVDDSGISLGMLLRRLKPGVGACLGKCLLQCRQVLDEGREILAGKAVQACFGQRADRLRAAAVAERRELAGKVPRARLPDHLLLTLDAPEHLHLASGADA